MTIYYITGLCEVLFKAIFFILKSGSRTTIIQNLWWNICPTERSYQKKKDMSEHKCEQKILQAFTQVK